MYISVRRRIIAINNTPNFKPTLSPELILLRRDMSVRAGII